MQYHSCFRNLSPIQGEFDIKKQAQKVPNLQTKEKLNKNWRLAASILFLKRL